MRHLLARTLLTNPQNLPLEIDSSEFFITFVQFFEGFLLESLCNAQITSWLTAFAWMSAMFENFFLFFSLGMIQLFFCPSESSRSLRPSFGRSYSGFWAVGRLSGVPAKANLDKVQTSTELSSPIGKFRTDRVSPKWVSCHGIDLAEGVPTSGKQASHR